MGTDEHDLLEYTTGYNLRGLDCSLRLEIDLWPSFIYVDLDILDWSDEMKKYSLD